MTLERFLEIVNKKEQEITKLKGDVVSSQKDGELSVQQLKEKYEFMLKAKDEEIEKTLNIALEMCERGYKIGIIDLNKSLAAFFAPSKFSSRTLSAFAGSKYGLSTRPTLNILSNLR